MMMTQRWIAPADRGASAQTLWHAAAAGIAALLLLAGPLPQAHATKRAAIHDPHPHHATALRTQASADTRKHAGTTPKGKGDKHAAHASKAEPAARGAAAKAHTKGHHGKQIEADEPDPVVLHRAAHAKPQSRQVHAPEREVATRYREAEATPVPRPRESHEAHTEDRPASADEARLARHSARQSTDAHRELARAAAAAAAGQSKASPTQPAAKPLPDSHAPLTVADFMRAAGATPQESAPAAAQQAEALEHGESHPDDDERLPVRAQNQIAPKPQPVARAVQPPAPIVRQAPSPAAVVPATTPMRSAIEAALASNRVDGFGAEGLPVNAANSPRAAKAAKGSVAARNNVPVVSAAVREEITEEAVKPMVLPAIYSRGGRLVMPAPLKGSREILVHQNQMADQAGLERIQDDDMLDDMRAQHLLVNFAESASLHVNESLPLNRRAARPWTVRFAADAGRAFYGRFGAPLQVNSAVRTVAFQLRLQRTNGNAAAVDGDGASPHLTGQAIDFGKRGMSRAQIAWMRAYLMPLIDTGKIDVEEEFQQACFHISVYRSYMPAVVHKRAAKVEVAQAHTPRLPKPVRNDDQDALQ